MQDLSLKKKIIIMVFTISVVCPIIAGFIIHRNDETLDMYQVIADRSLPRTRQMGKTLTEFKQVRIQFRQLAIRGLSPDEIKATLRAADESVKVFKKTKDTLTTMMSITDEEKRMSAEVEAAWKKFEELGGSLIDLAQKGDVASLDQIGILARTICPGISKNFEKTVENMIEWQDKLAIKRTVNAQGHAKNTMLISILLALIAVVVSLIGGTYFASTLVKTLNLNVLKLSQSAEEISDKSNEVAGVSSSLSEAALEQAASLQETVASIDQISAMISRNSDSAVSSAKISENSTHAAQKGKDKVELMMDSINAIASGNNEIIDQMQRSNREISEIVTVIKDISQKTQVINDIVFQTKLLSFNASVEAARAGEHGKGFAVVAEEVGNLASMSGKAATEITDMLTKSVKRVTDIVDGTKGLMDNMIKQSKEKVELGTNTAKECAEALDEILSNVSSVNEMIREISTASQEQSTGVREVNKAMSQLDQVTQRNSSAAQSSSHAATHLNDQVERLNSVVMELSRIVEGGSGQNIQVKKSQAQQIPQNVVRIDTVAKAQAKSEYSQPVKKAVGMNSPIPKSNDSRFEDV